MFNLIEDNIMKKLYFVLVISIICSMSVFAQFKITNTTSLSEAKLFNTSNVPVRLWTTNFNNANAYGFGVDASGYGNIFCDINNPTTSRFLLFKKEVINLENYFFNSINDATTNRIHTSNKTTLGGMANYDFNTYSAKGLIFETQFASYETSGIYFDDDFISIWSPGDQNRLVRFYDEDYPSEVAYIDGVGAYFNQSDTRLKENISNINDGLAKINAINGVEYNFINRNSIEEKDNPEKINNNRHYGFLAQELEGILPYAVNTDEFGNKFINYDAVIPVLVEAVKDLSNEVSSLKESFNKVNYDATAGLTAIDGKLPEQKTAFLFQNTPNPFSMNTEIKYFIPAETASARLIIYNLAGTQIKSINITKKGYGSEIIIGKELTAGMYYYSLIVDNKEIDTKKMILVD